MKRNGIRGIALALILCMILAVPALAQSNGAGNGNGHSNGRHSAHVHFVVSNGIMKGDGNGNYDLDDYVQRADVVVMIVRAFKLSAVMDGNFPDVEENSYYYDAIATAKSMGIARGDGRHFYPHKNVTVEQAILMIERAVKAANSNVTVDEDFDLRTLFNASQLSDYATRQDVADMLYYILTGDVKDSETNELGTIRYSTDEYTPAFFDSGDFSDALAAATQPDKTLAYVKFALPAALDGTLYWESEAAVSGTAYWADDSLSDTPDLSGLSFLPRRNSETVSIAYTAWDTEGTTYIGTVEISIAKAAVDLDRITYTVKEGTSFSLDSGAFLAVYPADANPFSHVVFSLPDSRYGSLFYDGVTAVTSSVSYSEEDLLHITFVPSAGFTGTLYLKYTAYDTSGEDYTGVIRVTVYN